MQATAGAQVPDPAAAPATAFRATNIDPSIFRVQVQLDRAGFGPGVIDGRKGRFFTAAVKGYQAAQGLTQSGELDDATRAALDKDDAPALMTMVLKDDALAADFTPDIPAKIVDQAALPNLGYRDIVERLAERFHTTPQLLLALNPALKVPQAGMELRLPSLIPADRAYDNSLSPQWRDTLATLNISSQQPQAAKIIVDKSESLLKVFDAQDRLVAQFPATTGSDHDPLPIGRWAIEAIAFLPTYHYNPDLFWDAAESDGKAVLQPGPNNPVGVVWIDLDKPHYGIHGTPEPSRIGRSQSHGCVRLSNWDAARLAQMTSTSTQVIFQE
ncbi:Lipoprotein-anchoring transpeptidase ErfK/SrfK [Sphingobium sp. AP50]|uniref:L,D-transpeptidase family protein n=1 Tax=Sphingobium sp. AP50 TaxID=1884369 RepID=UPI0008B90F76|nr:L,D-transpeptidase family protein [Sphingobium sp. AP50]SEK07117.1 Lipoprotein-anchoring transpeptidase ErfK/SrfK [Sphingobium sp. AP50]